MSKTITSTINVNRGAAFAVHDDNYPESFLIRVVELDEAADAYAEGQRWIVNDDSDADPSFYRNFAEACAYAFNVALEASLCTNDDSEDAVCHS